MKKCSKCDNIKSPDCFDKSSRYKCGLRSDCKECRAAAYMVNCDVERARRKANRERNPEAAAERFNRWKRDNLERFKEYQLKYRIANVGRKSQYEKENAAWRNAYENERRAKKLKATPKWADIPKVRQFYKDAFDLNKLFDLDFEVDHIVPLNSSLVCGLHNEFNLQIMPGYSNRSKGNRFWPYMPGVD